MPTREITLKVQNVASNGADDYTNAIASDGTVYSYQFSEKDSNGNIHFGGNVTFNLGGATADKVKVKLDDQSPGKKYEIDYVDFADDVNQQLSWRPGNSRYQAMIDNQSTKTASVYYVVVVLDTSKHYCTITCDPMINNR